MGGNVRNLVLLVVMAAVLSGCGESVPSGNGKPVEKSSLQSSGTLQGSSLPSGSNVTQNQNSNSNSKKAPAPPQNGTTNTGLTLYISDLYQNLFKRQHDADGMAYWVAQYSKGLGCRDITNGFLLSGEFTRVRQQGISRSSIASYVTALYRGVLGRAPDEEGAMHWIRLLGNGTNAVGVELIEAEFLNSAEFRQRCAKYRLNY